MLGVEAPVGVAWGSEQRYRYCTKWCGATGAVVGLALHVLRRFNSCSTLAAAFLVLLYGGFCRWFCQARLPASVLGMLTRKQAR